jgi:hypothetical protein
MSSFRYGSHLPMLIQCVAMTEGGVVEFGSGVNSTIFLHWACQSKNRQLLTLENDREYYKQVSKLDGGYHKVQFVEKWTDDIGKGVWSVVLIDHHPSERRVIDARRFTDSEYVILHDSNQYDYSSLIPLFKYNFEYTNTNVHTLVVSNVRNLTEFDL